MDRVSIFCMLTPQIVILTVSIIIYAAYHHIYVYFLCNGVYIITHYHHAYQYQALCKYVYLLPLCNYVLFILLGFTTNFNQLLSLLILWNGLYVLSSAFFYLMVQLAMSWFSILLLNQNKGKGFELMTSKCMENYMLNISYLPLERISRERRYDQCETGHPWVQIS